jgi:hypothetical protein
MLPRRLGGALLGFLAALRLQTQHRFGLRALARYPRRFGFGSCACLGRQLRRALRLGLALRPG